MKTKNDVKKDIQKASNFWTKTHTNFLAILEVLPDDLIKEAKINTYSTDFNIELPYSIEAFYKARRQLGKGWKRVQTWGNAEPGHTYKCIAYKHADFPNTEIRFSLQLESDNGSTCKLNQVGEKVTPIYEVVCGEQS